MLDRAIEIGHYRDERVYFFDSQGLHMRNFDNSLTFTSDKGVGIYEVAPMGELESDPDPTALPNFACCPRARVVRQVWPLAVPELVRDPLGQELGVDDTGPVGGRTVFGHPTSGEP